MWQVSDVIVVSDLHLSSEGQGRGLFGNDAGLEEFLLWVLAQTHDCVVVLNGDVLDFLFADSNPGLDSAKLEGETAAIIERHETVFTALGKVACSRSHSLVILSGNHDPELIFPCVRHKIEMALTVKGQRPHVRWLVNGEALSLKIGNAQALVEHGDRLDAWNEIDRDLLSSAASLGSRGLLAYHEYVPPLGSRLVTDHLRQLRKEFPWVELLKPEREAILPLLRYLASLNKLAKHAGALELYMRAETKSKLTKLRRKLDPATRFRKEDVDELSIGGRIKRMAESIFESRGELKRAELIRELQQASKHDTFYKEDVADGDYGGDLEFLLRNGSNLLIHGHTHSAKAYKVDDGLYLNSGTWARLIKLPASDGDKQVWSSFIKSIEDKSYVTLERPTYVRVTLEDQSTTRAALYLWPQDEPLAQWRFSERRQWLNQTGS